MQTTTFLALLFAFSPPHLDISYQFDYHFLLHFSFSFKFVRFSPSTPLPYYSIYSTVYGHFLWFPARSSNKDSCFLLQYCRVKKKPHPPSPRKSPLFGFIFAYFVFLWPFNFNFPRLSFFYISPHPFLFPLFIFFPQRHRSIFPTLVLGGGGMGRYLHSAVQSVFNFIK